MWGPEVHRPSWDWVGFDVSRALSQYYDIAVFNRATTAVPNCDLMVCIKDHPNPRLLEDVLAKKIKLLYCPVDRYEELDQIIHETNFLGQCHAVLVHSERLLPIFAPYCQMVEFVEHHNRFGLDGEAVYRPDGYVVWVGGMQHLPPVIKWLQKHPMGMEIKFVTNCAMASQRPSRGVFQIVDSHEIINWTPRIQRDLMVGAKAAFDIKGDSFNQVYKPPVKAQQFVVSGIPFAANPESYSSEYFIARGFKVPSPLETEYWFSHDYWQETQKFRDDLRRKLSLENVGLVFKHVIDNALGIS